jgi:hypothetical protein
MEVITLSINKMMNEKMMEVLVQCGGKYGFDGEEAYNWSIRECGMKKVGVGGVGVGVVSDKKDKKAEDLIASLMDVGVDVDMNGERDDEVSVQIVVNYQKKGIKRE